MLKIAIIGNGNVGQALGRRFRAAGHAVTFGAREPGGEDEVAVPEAIATAQIVVLAVPYGAAQSMAQARGAELSGKILIDATNPVAEDWSPIDTGGGSGAEAMAAPVGKDVAVVKAFNTVFADVMQSELSGTTTFVAGDDPAAVETAMALATSAGFAPVACGALSTARYLEAVAHLNIAIATGGGGNTRARLQLERLGN